MIARLQMLMQLFLGTELKEQDLKKLKKWKLKKWDLDRNFFHLLDIIIDILL